MGSLKAHTGNDPIDNNASAPSISDEKILPKKMGKDASLIINEDTDSFIIGDRVWVSGTKPGAISYIGETQFAPGMWAGVTLDDQIGKNDGTVGGVRYFQCESKKGVFSRLNRLSRSPLTDFDLDLLTSRVSTIDSDSPRTTPAHSVMSAPITCGLRRTSNPDSRKVSPPPRSLQVHKVPVTPSAVFCKPSTPAPASARKSITQVSSSNDLRMGERVVIDSNAGMKAGALRYLGRTEFADGIWAGVELDEPTGKNNGSVAGKKYFVCSPQFGLFAPKDRVSRQGYSSRKLSGIAVPSNRSSIPSMRRSNSRESLGGSSVASSTVSSLRGNRRPSRTSGYGMGGTSKALQNVEEEEFF